MERNTRVVLLAITMLVAAGCSRLHNLERPTPPPQAAEPAPPRPAPAPAAPQRVVAAEPLSFPIATASPRPLQADLDRLASALANARDSGLCGHVALGPRRPSYDDATLPWRTMFGPFADRFATTFGTLLVADDGVALLTAATTDVLLDQPSALPGQRFAQATDYLLFSLAAGSLQRVCESPERARAEAFDLLELATHPEAIRQLVVDTATQPLRWQDTSGLASTVRGTNTRFEAPRPYRWFRAAWDSATEDGTQAVPVEIEADGAWNVQLAASGRDLHGGVTSSNGSLDTGERVRVEVAIVNDEPFAIDSASLALIELPECAMVDRELSELVLPELDVGAETSFVLPELYLSGSCAGPQRVRFAATSSDHRQAATWTLTVDVTPFDVEVETDDLEEDEPGFSAPPTSTSRRVEFHLVATLPDPALDVQLLGAELIAPTSRNAWLADGGLGPMVRDAQGRYRSRLDADLATAAADAPPTELPIDRTGQAWLRVDLRLSEPTPELSPEQERQRALSEQLADALRALQSLAPALLTLRDQLLTPSVDDTLDAVRTLDDGGVLGTTGRARAYDYVDGLRCSGCDDVGLTPARRYLLASAWLQLARAGVLRSSGVQRMLTIDPARGIAELERAVLEVVWPDGETMPGPESGLDGLRLAFDEPLPEPPEPPLTWRRTRWLPVSAMP